MDELEKKSEEGLRKFRDDGHSENLSRILNSRIDSLLDDKKDDAKPPDKSNQSLSRWGIIIISLLGLFLIGYLGYSKASHNKVMKKSSSELFAQYFEAIPSSNQEIVRGSEVTSLPEERLSDWVYYANKEYEQAAKFLRDNDDSESLVYAGISYLHLSKSEKAIGVLHRASKAWGNEKYKDMRLWYLALAYLQSNQLKEAKVILTNISNLKGHYKKENAVELLSSLQ